MIAHGAVRVGPGAGARRRAGRVPRRTSPPTGSRTSPTTPTPAATCAGCCARPGCGSARDEARSGGARRARPGAVPLHRDRRAARPTTGGAGMLKSTIEPLAWGPTYRLVHDDLSDDWAPVWFVGLRRARRRRTGSPTWATATSPTCCRERAARRRSRPAVDELTGGDRIAGEQVVDLLRCNFFRQSVLCRDSLRPADAAGRRRDPRAVLRAPGEAGAEAAETGLLALGDGAAAHAAAGHARLRRAARGARRRSRRARRRDARGRSGPSW